MAKDVSQVIEATLAQIVKILGGVDKFTHPQSD